MAKLPWWRTEEAYDEDVAVPQVIIDHAGPNGLALVKAWPSGMTDQGWGLHPPKGSDEGFMPRYERGEFNARRVLYGYDRKRWAFAFIMRALKLVCIDIDGKNGGLEAATQLGALPYTLAETSKSGDGYHLFYLHEEPWNLVTGYGALSDRIGLVQGVDVRAVGCVYHHDTQRWNGLNIAPLPAHLEDLLLTKERKAQEKQDHIAATLAAGDEMEVLMMHDQILNDLKKDIQPGKRNITLYAIGCQMAEAGVPDWEDKLRDRGVQLGLDDAELERIITNAGRVVA